MVGFFLVLVWFFFVREELDTGMKLQVWIRAADHVNPVKSRSLVLKLPVPRISEDSARNCPIGGIISTSFFSHMIKEFKLRSLVFEALPESCSILNWYSSVDCS